MLPGQMITRMTERISDRLREELMIELRREQLSADDEKQAIGTKVEEMLNDDLSANTCLVSCSLLLCYADRCFRSVAS